MSDDDAKPTAEDGSLQKLLENLRADQLYGIGNEVTIKCGGRYLSNDIGQAINEMERLQSQWIAMKDEVNLCHAALREIRDHWANQYDHPRKQSPMYEGPYGIGVTDGHRAAAIIAIRCIGESKSQ